MSATKWYVHLICLRIPFMKVVALPCGKLKQRAIHGPTVNIPTNLTLVCTLPQRLPSPSPDGSIEAKEKTVLFFSLRIFSIQCREHYMFQYVAIRPAKVLTGLQWLKSNNPL